MSQNSSLFDWLSSIGVTKELNNVDILSGVTVNATLAKIVPNYTVRLPTSNTASTRINNWNTVTNQLEKVGIKVVQQDKSKILNGDDKVVYGILYELKQMHQKSREEVQVDINKIDSRGDPRTSKSLLELFILVIIKHFSFSVKEAVALLSNDSKYLAHILAKGFKDNPHPVENLLFDLMKLIPQINNFCKNKENQTFFLKSIKPALISKYLSIMKISLQLLTEFVKDLPDKVEIVKTELMPTFVLSQRRHGCQIRSIIDSLLEIMGFNINLVNFILNHSQLNQAPLLLLELLNAGQEVNQLHEVFNMYKFTQFVQQAVDNLRSSDLFSNSGTFLLKVLECNFPQLLQKSQLLSKMIQTLSLSTLSKRGDTLIFTNLIFAFLHIFGSKKNQIAPQFFKLAVDKYRNNLNQDESQNFLLNFINIIDIFPSIPSATIAEAILFRYQTSTSYIGELQLQLIQTSIATIDEKGALRIYNIITKIFVQEVGRIEPIMNILESIIKKFDSKVVFEINIKFVKICLAIYYANIRKLNYNKSLVEGIVKLDASNAFHKVKNNEIQQLLNTIVSIRDTSLNQAIQPLICYTFFQAQMKNKEESQGIKTVMLLLGDEEQLRKLYEADARLLLQQARNEGKKKDIRTKEEGKARVSSDASLLNKKKDYLLHHPPKVSLDAQKGLEKYTKAFKEKMVKLSLEEQKKLQDEQRLQELRKKFTMKILEKGIKIAKDVQVNCIYDYGVKQKELEKDLANDFSYLPFYDPERQEDRDVKAVQYFTKKYNKLFRVYYNNYGGKLRPNTIKLFDDISHTANLMQTANVWKLLRDNDLDLFITVKEVQHTVQKINAHLKKEYKDSSLLDFQVFENFLTQAALIMFSRPPKDMRTHPLSDMLQEIVIKLKQHAHENKIDEKLFDEIDNYQSTKNEEIKDLNEKLSENPDYILPEGFKKITVKKLVFNYEFHLDQSSNINESFKDIYQVLDEILFEKFEFHLLEPSSSTSTEATARPILYQTNYMESSIKERSLSSALPKASRMRETTVRQGQGEEEPQQIEQGVQLKESRSPSHLQKVENKFLKEKKIKEEERQKRLQEEEKKREQRDKQLKALLEKHREKQQQMDKEKEDKRKEELQRQQEQKKRKQKYQEDLKKRVEQYMKKKETEKMREEEERRRKKEQESKNFQKMKHDIERKKRLVQESKMRKKQEEQQRLQREKEEKKRQEEQNKIKLEEKKQRTRQMIEQYRQRKQREEEEKMKQKLTQPESQIKSKQKIKASTVRKSKNSPPKSKEAKEPQNTEVKVQQIDNS